MPFVVGEVDIGPASLTQIKNGLNAFPTTLSYILPSPYGPPKPVIWSEDFESVPANQTYFQTRSAGANQIASRPSGWGADDNGLGCIVAVSRDRAVRGQRSLLMRSPVTVADGKADIHRSFGVFGAHKIGLEFWWCFSQNMYNKNMGFHWSLEYEDTANLNECVFEYFSEANIASGNISTLGWGSLSQTLTLAPYDYTTNSPLNEQWHYVKVVADFANKVGVQLIIDNTDLSSSINNVTLRQIGFNGLASFDAYNKPLRLELGPLTNNAATHVSPTDDFSVYVDDIVLTLQD